MILYIGPGSLPLPASSASVWEGTPSGVGPSVGIPDRVGQLVLDEVGPGRSGPAFWLATPRSALLRPGARCPEGCRRGRPVTRAGIPGQAAGRAGSRAHRVRLRRSRLQDHHGAPLLERHVHRGLWKALRERGRSIEFVAVVRTRGNVERARTILKHWATASTASRPSRHGA